MPYPTPIVEIAFTDGPYVVSPTWTDVTSYVRGMEISRGTNDDWNLVADGLANVVLSNRDRRFDPFNASGPYFGNLLPRRQIRIRATSGGTTYDVFRGFIAGWPPEWTDAGYDSTVTLSCFDALQLLGSSSLPANWADQYIRTLSPRHYYPLEEPVSPGQNVVATDYGSYPQALTVTNPVPETNLGQGLSEAMELTSALTTIDATTFGTNCTVSLWSNYGRGNIFYVGRFTFSLYLDTADDRYTCQIIDSATSTQYFHKSTAQFTPGSPFMFTVVFDASTLGATLYINGSVITKTVTSSAIAVPLSGEGLALFGGVYQQLLVFHYQLSAAQIRAIYDYSEALFLETTAARVNRIIAETPFSSSLVSTPNPPAATVLAITDNAPTASSELANVAYSEYGQLFVNKAGVVTMFRQGQIFSQTKSIQSQVTYGQGGIPIGTEVQLQYDADSMRNVANVEMTGGAVYIKTNTTSISTYGEAEEYVSTQVSNLGDASDVAENIVPRGSFVYPKASPVQVVLSPDGTWASTLGLELWERFTLVVAPPTGSAISTPMLLTRISHSVTPERWSTTVEGSARWAALFILNQSRLGGTDLLG